MNFSEEKERQRSCCRINIAGGECCGVGSVAGWKVAWDGEVQSSGAQPSVLRFRSPWDIVMDGSELRRNYDFVIQDAKAERPG